MLKNGKYAFLHVNKCGGTRLFNALMRLTMNIKYYGHDKRFENIPGEYYVIIPLRDPISRYVSAINHCYRAGFIDLDSILKDTYANTKDLPHCRKNYSQFIDYNSLISNQHRILPLDLMKIYPGAEVCC